MAGSGPPMGMPPVVSGRRGMMPGMAGSGPPMGSSGGFGPGAGRPDMAGSGLGSSGVMPGAGSIRACMPADGSPGMPGSDSLTGGAPGDLAGNAGASVEPAKAERETFMVKAERAMQQGNEKLAFDYVYASALAEDSTEVLDKFMWVNAFKRPAVAVRWGIGVDVTVSPKSYEGNYYPVGSTQTIPERTSKNRRTGGGQRGGAWPGGLVVAAVGGPRMRSTKRWCAAAMPGCFGHGRRLSRRGRSRAPSRVRRCWPRLSANWVTSCSAGCGKRSRAATTVRSSCNLGRHRRVAGRQPGWRHPGSTGCWRWLSRKARRWRYARHAVVRMRAAGSRPGMSAPVGMSAARDVGQAGAEVGPVRQPGAASRCRQHNQLDGGRYAAGQGQHQGTAEESGRSGHRRVGGV